MPNNFLKYEELKQMCERSGIVNDVKIAKSAQKALVKIKPYLEEGKFVSDSMMEKYRKELKNQDNTQTTNADSDNQNSQGNQNSEDNNSSADSSSNQDETEPDNQDNPQENNQGEQNNQDQQGNPQDPNKQKPKGDSNDGKNKKDKETTESKTEEEKSVAFLNKDKAKQLEESINRIEELMKQVEKLENWRKEEAEKKTPINLKADDKQKTFLNIISDLNELLNSNSDKITVSINKELLSKATRYVDDNSLIRLESIVRSGYDLNSTIVQSILLAFIHSNSLL